jgi:ribosomal protein S6
MFLKIKIFHLADYEISYYHCLPIVANELHRQRLLLSNIIRRLAVTDVEGSY